MVFPRTCRGGFSLWHIRFTTLTSVSFWIPSLGSQEGLFSFISTTSVLKQDLRRSPFMPFWFESLKQFFSLQNNQFFLLCTLTWSFYWYIISVISDIILFLCPNIWMSIVSLNLVVLSFSIKREESLPSTKLMYVYFTEKGMWLCWYKIREMICLQWIVIPAFNIYHNHKPIEIALAQLNQLHSFTLIGF